MGGEFVIWAGGDVDLTLSECISEEKKHDLEMDKKAETKETQMSSCM